MNRDDMFSTSNLEVLSKLTTADLNMRLAILRKLELDNADDPRLDKEGGVRDQIKALDAALKMKTGKPSNITISLDTLTMKARAVAQGAS